MKNSIFRTLLLSLSMFTSVINAMVVVDQDLVTPPGLAMDPVNITIQLIAKDIFSILLADSVAQANSNGGSFITYNVNKNRLATLHFTNNLIILGDPVYSFINQKIGCGTRQWVIEPGNTVTFQPNANNTAPVNLPNHITWKGAQVYNIQDHNLLLKRDIELPDGDILVEAKHTDILVCLERPLTLTGNAKGTTRIHFNAHTDRTITIVADKNLQFVSQNHQLIMLEEGCGTVQWQIPPVTIH